MMVCKSKTGRALTAHASGAPLGRRGFTLVELLVVIAIIVLVLAVALPGMSALSSQTRTSAAVQRISAVLSRAYNLAVAEGTLVAVRFVPAEWETREQAGGPAGRQRVAVYQYVGDADRYEAGGFKVQFNEYFKRAAGVDVLDLPEDVWVAPLESLVASPDASITLGRDVPGLTQFQLVTYSGPWSRSFILDGPPGQFTFDPVFVNGSGAGDSQFLPADDFLVVFDPRSGLVGGVPQPFRLKAYSPLGNVEVDRSADDPGYSGTPTLFQRFNFTGLVVYSRDAFIGAGANPGDRQEILRTRGQPYTVSRHGGALVPSAAAPR